MGAVKNAEIEQNERSDYIDWVKFVGKDSRVQVCMDCGNRAYNRSQYCYHQYEFSQS